MKKGFTLAEVLITLGIIGIVSAMTIPALMTNMRRKQATVKLKKFHSTMKQALLLATDEYGDVGAWDKSLSYEEYTKTYFVPYLKGTFELRNGESGGFYQRSRFVFQDGTFFSYYRGSCMDIYYDVNGNLPPNKEGRDGFRFIYCPDGTDWCDGNGGFCTYRKGSMTSRSSRLQACRQAGMWCSSLLEYDHWEFLQDYPY